MEEQLGLGVDGSGEIAAFVIDAQLGAHGRKDIALGMSPGLAAIVAEARKTITVDVAGLDEAKRYKTLLWSITSPVEVEKLRKSGYSKPPGQTVIAGGMGALNPWAVHDFADAMVFGRAEGQVAEILEGKTLPNVWRKFDDPSVEGRYEIRQAHHLLEDERQVGCPNKCLFCQYTWVRKHTVPGLSYRSGHVTPEDDWNRLEITGPGRYITALDGWSEETRLRVRKHITDEQVIDKLRGIQECHYPAATVIKVYMIVGYPWETPESVMRDMSRLREVFALADAGHGGRVVLMLLVTPFSPEPMTPMEGAPVRPVDWRHVIEQGGRALYWSDHLEAFVLPQIALPETLLRRVAVNRCDPENADDVSRYLEGDGGLPPGLMGEWGGYPFLSTYCDYRKHAARSLATASTSSLQSPVLQPQAMQP